ncbi:MAG: RidA family protein [Thermoflexales bacterium]|nr:RidA family protein [Thermoflexales bacterium]
MDTSTGTIDKRLAELGLSLPEGPLTPTLFLSAVRTGNLLFVSGHISRKDGVIIKGKVGRDLTLEQAQEAARHATLELLAGVKRTLGSLDRVRRVVKILGMVNSTETFDQQHIVMHAASQLLLDVFGDPVGRHARSAVGMAQMPHGCALEIEAVLEVE